MKITIWNECYTSGGADWVVIDLIESWPNPEDEFIIFVNETHEGLQLLKDKTKGKAKVQTYKSFMESVLKLRNFKPFELMVQKFGQLGKLPLWLLVGPFSLFASFFLISKKNCDVLILNNGGYPGGLSNFIIAFWSKIKNIKKRYMIVHNYPLKTYEESSRIRFFKWFSQKTLTNIITVSNSLRNALISDASLNQEMVKMIYNGINIENKFSNQSKNIGLDKYLGIKEKVGIIGNLEERKGHDVLFKAWKSVIDSYPNAKLFIFGSSKSGDKNKLIKLAEELNISETLIWIEFTPNIGEAYKMLDVVVMPSKNFESFGRIIIETMAFEKPIIASRVGGMPELIENQKDGLLFDAEDDKTLASHIKSLLASPDFRQSLGQNGRIKYTSYFTSEKMSQNYADFIR